MWSLEARARHFWPKVQVSGPDECWFWLGHIRRPPSLPYGWSSFRNRGITAHRLAWILTFGEIDDPRLLVCHSCDNPPCCNPKHLFLGTAALNAADMAQKGRARNKPGPLSDAQVRAIRQRMALGDSCRKIAKDFNVGFMTASRIRARQAYARVI